MPAKTTFNFNDVCWETKLPSAVLKFPPFIHPSVLSSGLFLDNAEIEGRGRNCKSNVCRLLMHMYDMFDVRRENVHVASLYWIMIGRRFFSASG